MTRILIADDHELLRRGLKGILAEAFPKLATGEATDARQTLATVEKERWDIVLLDINMPGRSGLEVLQDLKRLHPQMPVVILSAFPEKDYAIRAFKLGASGYVSKQRRWPRRWRARPRPRLMSSFPTASSRCCAWLPWARRSRKSPANSR